MSTLLSKTADTNIFIRDEAMKALEAMVENVPPQKSLAVVISSGAGYDRDLLLTATTTIAITTKSGSQRCRIGIV